MTEQMSLEFRCKGCGAVGSIVEVELTPRVHHGIVPDGLGGVDYAGAEDEAFWESSFTLGFACDNEDCRFWQGGFGSPVLGDRSGLLAFDWAPRLDDIADVVEV